MTQESGTPSEPRRYVVMTGEGARAAGVPGVDAPQSEWDYDHDVLVDTKRNVVVYRDWDVHEAPEDMYLDRDLRVFVNELNRLAEEAKP